MESIEDIRQILELGWPAIVTFFVIVLYRDYKTLLASHQDVYKSLQEIALMLRQIMQLQRSMRDDHEPPRQ